MSDSISTSFQGLFPKKRRSEAPVETVVASKGFPVSSRQKQKNPTTSQGAPASTTTGFNPSRTSSDASKPHKPEKLLDWHKTAHEVRQLGATAFVKQQKRDYQDEAYQRLTGRPRKKQKVPLPIVRGIRRKQAQREKKDLAEARAAGRVVPKTTTTSRSQGQTSHGHNPSRIHGPAPSIGFVKQGVLHLKRKPV